MSWFYPDLSYFLGPVIWLVMALSTSITVFIYRRNSPSLHLAIGLLIIITSMLVWILFIVAPTSQRCVISLLNNTTRVSTCYFKYRFNYYSILAIVPVIFGFIHIIWWSFLTTEQSIEYVLEEVGT